jgi:sigma-B regulation protein RsbU (phosphoserine phosphatase)
MSGIKFEQFETQLFKGDRILILSDGVTECPDPDGKMFEEEGLERLMSDLHDVKGQAFLDALIWNLMSFA